MLRVLESVSLKAYPGQITTLLGSNGAGKSTTLACAQGLMRPDGGSIELLGQDPYGDNPELRARVGVMLQTGGAWSGSRAVEMLDYVASLYADPLPVPALVDRLGLGSCGRVWSGPGAFMQHSLAGRPRPRTPAPPTGAPRPGVRLGP